MKDGDFIFSQLACQAPEMPGDWVSVSALQFWVAIHVTQRGRIAEIRERTGEGFSLQFLLRGFVQSSFKWLELLKWFKLWHFGRVWNKIWQRCYDWRAGFVLFEMCGKSLFGFSQNGIGSSESLSLSKLSKTSTRISFSYTITLLQSLSGSPSSVYSVLQYSQEFLCWKMSCFC